MNSCLFLFSILLFCYFPLRSAASQKGDIFIHNILTVNSFSVFSHDKERSFEDPSGGPRVFENIIDFENIGDNIIWNRLFKSVKRGDKIHVKYHKCFHNPVACFKWNAIIGVIIFRIYLQRYIIFCYSINK